MTVEVPAIPPGVLAAGGDGEPSSAVRDRVVAARLRQLERVNDHAPVMNAALTPGQLARCCRLDARATTLLSTAVQRLGLSARGYDRVRKVARTIADLEAVPGVSADHVAEALQFRMS